MPHLSAAPSPPAAPQLARANARTSGPERCVSRTRNRASEKSRVPPRREAGPFSRMLTQMNERPIWIWFERQPAARLACGRLIDSGDRQRRFTCWLELLSILESSRTRTAVPDDQRREQQ